MRDQIDRLKDLPQSIEESKKVWHAEMEQRDSILNKFIDGSKCISHTHYYSLVDNSENTLNVGNLILRSYFDRK